MAGGTTELRTTRSRWGERLSQHFRDRRSGVLRDLLARESAARGGRVRLLDLGGRFEFWRRFGLEFLDRHGVEIAILNLTPGESGDRADIPPNIRFLVGDATATGFDDASYDVVMSNSVVEHLGTWEAMIAFADETRRLAPTYYCQTPNFWFPIDPHYFKAPLFHWMPRPTRAWMLRTFPIATAGRASSIRKSYAMTDYARLLSRTQMRDLFPDACMVPERVLGVFVKSWTAVRERG